MASPEQRERENRESDVTKFEELADQVDNEQREAAKKIAEPLEPREDES